MKHVSANAMTLLIVAALVAAGAILWGVRSYDAKGPLAEATMFEVRRGDTLDKAADRLEKAGVIADASIFRIGGRYTRVSRGLKFGEYEIPAGASMREVMDILVSGRAIQHPLTFAEGLTSWEIVERLKKEPLLTGEIDEVPPEGALAPDTYFIARGSTRAAVLARMKATQTERVRKAWEARDPNSPLESPLELLVLASIVEKETGVAAERALVAGVFVNRLRKGMRLQSDPTIIYGVTKGIGALDRPILRSDINKPTPWNTYVIDRLPPTPIANPGADALMAAAKPDETRALYFVADGSGGHAFAETLREHERNVAAWRRIERSRATE